MRYKVYKTNGCRKSPSQVALGASAAYLPLARLFPLRGYRRAWDERAVDERCPRTSPTVSFSIVRRGRRPAHRLPCWAGHQRRGV
jgi:hypothetical protein